MSSVADGYRIAEQLTARHGRTYHLAARLLPADGRRAVAALYGYARIADDIVDDPRPVPPAERLAALDRLTGALAAALAGDPMPPGLPGAQRAVVAALADTVARYRIDPATFTAFARSMAMDVPGGPGFRNRYRDFAELGEYTYGSAAVIGLQLLPVLGVHDPAELRDGAALLGEAFQLTNFLRDVGEDLRRDRIYLPADQLAAFGVDEAVLRADARAGAPSPALRRALAHLVAVNRDQYRRAAPAVAALPGRTRPAIAAAAASYAAILTEIEDSGFTVLTARAVVPRRRRLRHAATALLAPRPAGS